MYYGTLYNDCKEMSTYDKCGNKYTFNNVVITDGYVTCRSFIDENANIKKDSKDSKDIRRIIIDILLNY